MRKCPISILNGDCLTGLVIPALTQNSTQLQVSTDPFTTPVLWIPNHSPTSPPLPQGPPRTAWAVTRHKPGCQSCNTAGSRNRLKMPFSRKPLDKQTYIKCQKPTLTTSVLWTQLSATHPLLGQFLGAPLPHILRDHPWGLANPTRCTFNLKLQQSIPGYHSSATFVFKISFSPFPSSENTQKKTCVLVL